MAMPPITFNKIQRIFENKQKIIVVVGGINSIKMKGEYKYGNVGDAYSTCNHKWIKRKQDERRISKVHMDRNGYVLVWNLYR